MIELPICRHRGKEITPGSFSCTHPRLIVPPTGVTADGCVRCHAGGIFCDQPLEAIAKLKRPDPPPPAREPCVYLGPILEQSGPDGIPCDCAFKWLRTCEIHGECSLSECGRSGVPACASCPDHDASLI
jgi:hypothetical protein